VRVGTRGVMRRGRFTRERVCGGFMCGARSDVDLLGGSYGTNLRTSERKVHGGG